MNYDLRSATRADVLSRLREWCPDGAPPEEMAGYIGQSAGRFLETARVLDRLPRGARVLEVGAIPYYLSLLARWARPDFDWIGTNWIGDFPADEAQEGWLTNHVTRQRERFTWYSVNIETGSMPFEPASFDAVVFCEVFEHLYVDPVRSLELQHSVLKPGGLFVLTTPNPARAYNLQRLLLRESFYDPISGYGPYGRHNREYSAKELVELVSQVGFTIEASSTIETSNDKRYRRALARAGYGEHHLVTARRRPGPATRYRPEWLYRSFPQAFFEQKAAPTPSTPATG
jgi:SAM-dependent methyltransferase